MVVVPWFKVGEVYFPEECKLEKPMVEMMEELKLASGNGLKSKHDDGIDTISMLAVMPVFLPGEDAPMQFNETAGVFESVKAPQEFSVVSTYVV